MMRNIIQFVIMVLFALSVTISPTANANDGGWLGVGLDEVVPIYEAPPLGVRVTFLIPGGPADRGGIKKDDIITSISGKTYARERDGRLLSLEVAKLSAHSKVAVDILRKGTPLRLELQLGSLSEKADYFEKKSRLGDAGAMLDLGLMYVTGEGVQQDLHRARELLEKAAEKGSPGAMHNVGVFYSKGWGGLSKDSRLAACWIEKAAKSGLPRAIADLRRNIKINAPSCSKCPLRAQECLDPQASKPP